MTDPVLLVERDAAVATLTMNRPETRNALNRELVLALGTALAEAGADSSVHVVILAGAGGAFCSGADLRAGLVDAHGDLPARMDEYHAMIRAIIEAPKPFIASIDGPAVGFGADLALACDLRVMSSHAYLQEKFVNIGLMPDGGGSFWMPRLVGIGRALEFLMMGTKIEAELALELGLCNRRVEPEKLEHTVRQIADELAKGPPLAHAAIKRAVREGFAGTIEDALAREKQEQLKLLKSQDVLEGVAAWAARREPKFQGK